MKPENLHLNRYHLNMGKNIYQHWMLSHLSEKNFSYRWLLIFFFFFFVCAKKRNCKYIKILLGTRKRWGMVDWLTKPLILSSDFLQKGCWSLQEAVQGQDLEGPLQPGPGTHHPWPWAPTPTAMPISLGMSPGPHSQLEDQTFCSFVWHLCGFRTPFRKQGHTPP